MDLAEIDLTGGDAVRNPYPAYRALREEDPVHWYEPFGGWLVTRYDDVAAGLRDPRLSAARLDALAERQMPRVPAASRRAFTALAERSVFFQDPPRHTAARGAVRSAIASAEQLEPTVRRVAGELLAAAAARGRFCAVEHLAAPLPLRVMAALLDIPRAEADAFQETMARQMRATARLFGGGAVCPAEVDDARAASRSALDHAARLAGRSAARGPLAALQAAVRAGAIDDDGCAMAFADLALAGQVPLTNVIAKGVIALLAHPEQWRRLAARPELARAAVEEILRWDSPNQFTTRVAARELEIRGRRVRRGDVVYLMLGAANRDPRVFADPDRFDVARRPNAHFAFGTGPHVCPGAGLARRQARVLFQMLCGQMPRLRMDGEVTWSTAGLRAHGPASVPVAAD